MEALQSPSHPCGRVASPTPSGADLLRGRACRKGVGAGMAFGTSSATSWAGLGRCWGSPGSSSPRDPLSGSPTYHRLLFIESKGKKPVLCGVSSSRPSPHTLLKNLHAQQIIFMSN